MDEDYRQGMVDKAEVLKALSHPVRLCLARKMYEHGSCSVSYFCDCMDTSQPNISQHLAKMRAAGIVGTSRDGQTVNYYIKSDEARQVLAALFGQEGAGNE